MDRDKKLWLNGQESCRTIKYILYTNFQNRLKGKT